MDNNTHTQFQFNANAQPFQKRTHEQFMLSSQLMHRFKSKSDFMTYFSESRK